MDEKLDEDTHSRKRGGVCRYCSKLHVNRVHHAPGVGSDLPLTAVGARRILVHLQLPRPVVCVLVVREGDADRRFERNTLRQSRLEQIKATCIPAPRRAKDDALRYELISVAGENLYTNFFRAMREGGDGTPLARS